MSEFNKNLLLDVNGTDEQLCEQLRLFFEKGYNGKNLVTLLSYSSKIGIANHVNRLMTLLREKVIPNLSEG